MRMEFNPNEIKNYAGANSDYTPLPTGNYEVIVKSVKEHQAKTGSQSLQLELVVRNDLDGVPQLAETNAKYHNRHVFLDLWKNNQTGQFNVKDIQSLLYQAGFNQSSLDFPTDFINFMTKKPLKAYIKLEDHTYNGKTTKRNRVAPFNVTRTDFPQVQHQWSDVQASEPNQGNNIDINFGNSHNSNPNPAPNNGFNGNNGNYNGNNNNNFDGDFSNPNLPF